MQRHLLILGATLLAACADNPDTDEQATPAPEAPQAAAPGDNGFALVVDNDTLAVEHYTRSGNQLQGELHDRGSGDRLRYTAQLDGDGRITSMELAFHAEGDTQPQQRATAEFRGDTLVTRDTEQGEQPERHRIVTPPGTMLQIANSVAMVEQLVRHTRARGEAGEAHVPVLLIGRDESQHEVIEHASVGPLAGDSVLVMLDQENQMRLAVDGQGRISGGVNPASNARIVRLR